MTLQSLLSTLCQGIDTCGYIPAGCNHQAILLKACQCSVESAWLQRCIRNLLNAPLKHDRMSGLVLQQREKKNKRFGEPRRGLVSCLSPTLRMLVGRAKVVMRIHYHPPSRQVIKSARAAAGR